MCLSAQWPGVLFCFNKLVFSPHQYQMNKLVISCPPRAVSVTDGRPEGHFLICLLLWDLLSFAFFLMTISSFAGFGKDGGF